MLNILFDLFQGLKVTLVFGGLSFFIEKETEFITVG